MQVAAESSFAEKTTFELPSPESGTLVKILKQAGDTVIVGTVIAHLERDGGTTAPVEKESQPQPSPSNEKTMSGREAISVASVRWQLLI